MKNFWILKMAWRDSRKNKRRLFLFISSIILGTSALVAITSIGENMEKTIDMQAKTLLGADLVIRSQQPFKHETETLIDSIGGEQSREISFASMIYFPKNGGTRLVQVRVIEGNFPYYGKLETFPESSAKTFRTGQYAIVDEGIMIQFGIEVGDSIKIGATKFHIEGSLKKIPGEAIAAGVIGPRVYIPMIYLDRTKLIQVGSLANYKIYFKFGKEVNVENLVKKIKPHLNKYRLQGETVARRKENLGKAMENLYNFLSLVGFIALILGSVGVASAIHVYIKQKLNTVAILRCLGAEAKQTFLIYLIQATTMGFVGSIIGALTGIGVQVFLPKVLQDFLPLNVEFSISLKAIFQGVLIGLGIALLFALLPLISIRNISPLLTLRSNYEDSKTSSKDPLRWLIYFLIVFGICGFAILQTKSWIYGLIFTLAIGLSFGLLALVAKLIMKFVKKYFPASLNYIWRQSLANLYRPNNQTLLLMLSLGLGTFLITTLYLTQNVLLKQVSLSSSNNKPNMILFDIQVDQKNEIENLVRSYNLPVIEQVPIVTMRIASIKGRSVEEIRNDSTSSIPRWALMWEYRSTYRDSLRDTEEIIEGEFQKRVTNSTDTIGISLAEDLSRNLDVKIGDEIIFDVQGVPIATKVGSFRKINWQRVQPNFNIVFPEGVLESAPQFYVFVTRVNSNEMSAKFQQAVVTKFPNVSVIDLALILSTVDNILNKVSFVIRFMALFSIITGLIVLAGSVIISKYQRIQEGVLLRTLGASRSQIIQIMIREYFFLGSFATLTGLILAITGSWALSYFVFDSIFVPAVLPIIIVFILIVGLTIFLGMINSKGVYNKPPLEILRNEV
jgi:putative ABC transport system permease protein